MAVAAQGHRADSATARERAVKWEAWGPLDEEEAMVARIFLILIPPRTVFQNGRPRAKELAKIPSLNHRRSNLHV